MAVALSPWLKSLLPQTPGAVRSVVRAKLLEAAREFYQESSCLREVVRRDVVADNDTYVIEPDMADVLTAKPLSVAFNRRPLEILMRRPDEVEDREGAPQGWYLIGTDTVVLWPKPTEAIVNGLSVYITLGLDPDVSTLPNIAKTEHFDVLIDGTLGLLKQQPAKPYSDLIAAQYHLRRFRNAIAKYKGLANRGNVPGGAGWTFNRFGK